MVFRDRGVRIGLSPQGRGVFALKCFKPREMIGPIHGTVIRDPAYQSEYCMEIDQKYVLEPDSPFRYVNHSCSPNCALVQVTAPWNGIVPIEGEIWLEVLTEIATGEQITIDYAWPATSAIPCRCGSPECRGWIVAADQVDQVSSKSPRSYSLRKTRPEFRYHVGRLYRLWGKWNQQFFAGRLSLPQIVLSPSDGSGSFGACGPSTHPGALSRIRLQRSLLTGLHPRLADGSGWRRRTRRGYRWAAEVLLHEMVHQWCRETVPAEARENEGHGAAFCRKCNEIGRALRLITVRSGADTRGKPLLPSCAQWPHNARGPLLVDKASRTA